MKTNLRFCNFPPILEFAINYLDPHCCNTVSNMKEYTVLLLVSLSNYSLPNKLVNTITKKPIGSVYDEN